LKGKLIRFSHLIKEKINMKQEPPDFAKEIFQKVCLDQRFVGRFAVQYHEGAKYL
jgi:hypothetical protein